MLVRLNKYLADRGVASRRACDEYIAAGRIKVNGEVVTKLGSKVDSEKDTIEVDPSLSMEQRKLVYFMLNKPVGYVCSVTGPEEPKITAFFEERPERVFPVGRLDKLSSGLLLVTNDGRLTYQMTHPKFEKEKEYLVKVREKVTPEALKLLAQPIYIEGRKTLPARVSLDMAHRVRIILTEGRNRQIRRLCKRAELTIERLKRIRIGKLELGDLPTGQYRDLTEQEKGFLGLS